MSSACGRWFVVAGAVLQVACVAGEKLDPAGDSTVTILAGESEWIMSPQAGDHPQHLVFLSLTRLDDQGTLQPRLAARWEHSSDYRTWTIHLRDDVSWHDGEPVTVQDVLFTWELLTHPDIGYWQMPIQSSSTPDDYTLTVTFSKPTIPLDGWQSIYPRHLLDQLDPAEYHDWEFWTRPVGNGPYRYVRHVPQTMMEFEANPAHPFGEPAIKKVVLKFGESSNALIQLLSGDVDAVRALSDVDVGKVLGDRRFYAHRNVNPDQARVLAWNHRHPLFREPEVRRALAHAVDRRAIHRVLGLPEGTPVYDAMLTMRQYLRGDLGEVAGHDPARARSLLEAAGWRDVDGDGFRERDSVEARLTLLVPVTMGGTLRTTERVAITIQQQLRAVGVRVDVQTREAGLVMERLRDGEFDATLPRFFHIPSGILDQGWLDRGSRIGYQNPELARLLKLADATPDPMATDSLFRAMRKIFRQDLPVLFLYPHSWTSAVHRRIKGLTKRAAWGGELFEYMEELWLEEDES